MSMARLTASTLMYFPWNTFHCTWNDLPLLLWHQPSLDSFKCNLKSSFPQIQTCHVFCSMLLSSSISSLCLLPVLCKLSFVESVCLCVQVPECVCVCVCVCALRTVSMDKILPFIHMFFLPGTSLWGFYSYSMHPSNNNTFSHWCQPLCMALTPSYPLHQRVLDNIYYTWTATDDLPQYSEPLQEDREDQRERRRSVWRSSTQNGRGNWPSSSHTPA